LSAFFNSFIEGSAASAFRASPGDADNGTWVTTNGYVEFTADMAGVEGLTGNNIVGFVYCTEYGCDGGAAVVATPEPATLALFATGLVAVAVIRRRRT